jgi:hypothetical protein
MPAGHVIVCETEGHWAVAFRAMGGDALPIVQTRSLAECRARLHEAPASVLVLELTESRLVDVAALVADLYQYPLARAMVVAARPWQHYERPFRELGCMAFTTSVLQVRSLVVAAQRRLKRVADPPAGLRQRLLARVPGANAQQNAPAAPSPNR